MFRAFAVMCVLVLCACGRTALLEGVTGDGSSPADASSNPACRETPPDIDAELMRRWNAAVDGLPPQRLDFHWRKLNDFPLATFRGGTPEAYQALAEVLERFWGEPTNRTFVECNGLFDRAYKSGPAVETQVTVRLRPLTASLANSPLVDLAHRTALTRTCTIIGC